MLTFPTSNANKKGEKWKHHRRMPSFRKRFKFIFIKLVIFFVRKMSNICLNIEQNRNVVTKGFENLAKSASLTL